MRRTVARESTFPVVTVKGDPYSRGASLGTQAKGMITKNIDYYLRLWSAHSHMDRDSVLSRSAKFIPMIRGFDSDILDEMKGIADGSERSLEEVVALNCRYEFVWTQMQFGAKGECTSAAAAPEATRTGHTLMGQNWDYKPAVKRDCIILEEIQEPRAPNIVIHTEAGIVGQKGINSAGIGLLVNALTSDRDAFQPAVPFWVLARGALNQRRIDRAMAVVGGAKRAVSGNLMLGQEGGEVIDLELTPDDFGFMLSEDGVLYHANNFVDPAIRAKVVDMIKGAEPDTLIRTDRARRSMRSHAGAVEMETFSEVFRDHFGFPSSVCAHPDPECEADFQTETIASVIYDLDQRTMIISRGQPCSNPYHTMKFDSISA